jgi:hypothetical protein
LVYSTYLGGSGQEFGSGIAVDSAGNAYATGQTLSIDFPVTPSAFQKTCGGRPTGCWDAFVAKINPAGSAFVYSTYLGGSGTDDGFAGAIAADAAGNAYVTGDTASTDFPTMNPLQASNAGAVNAYVTKINPSGSALVYSTYLGGSSNDWANGIAVDGVGNVYVAGQSLSSDFPTTPGAFQRANVGSYDAFVAKINPTGSALVYSTYLGGLNWDQANSIAVDTTGGAYVAGSTYSANFPLQNPSQAKKTGGTSTPDAYVSKLSQSGSSLIFSTYLGGSESDNPGGIAVDSAGNAYVVGSTNSTNFPTKNPLQAANGGAYDAFVTKIYTAAPTTTTLSSSLNPSVYRQAVTFTANVTSNIGTPPDGETVAFMEGTTSLGTGTLSGGSASFTTSALLVGTQRITAQFGGDSSFSMSTSAVTKQVVDKDVTSTTLLSSLNPSIYGQNVTWTASVTTSGPIGATGTVHLSWDGYGVGTATLNASGVATLTRSNLNADSYPIVAEYQGDANNGPSASAILNQVINQTTSAATLTSSPNPSTQGQAVTFTAKITSPTTVPTGPVNFTAGNTVLGSVELSGGKATFTTSSLPVGSTTVTVTYPWNSNIASSSASVTQAVDQ